MDNNGGYPYSYPYPNPSYPPPPPPISDPYSTPISYPPPQHGGYSVHSGPLDHRPPPPLPLSHSGQFYYQPPPPSSYPYPPPGDSYPQPNLHDPSNFQYSSSFSHYQGYPPPPPLPSDTLPSYHNQEGSIPEAPGRISDHGSPSVSSLYSHVNSLSLSDTATPSAPPAPSASLDLSHSFQSQSSNNHQGPEMYSYSNLSTQSSFVSDGSQNGQQIMIDKPSGVSRKVLLLHGNLDIWIHEARNLPNMDMFSKKLQEMVGALSGPPAGTTDGHKPHKSKMTSDPYVSISVCSAVVGRTYVMSNSENPVWTQHFYVPVAHNAAEVQFLVKDSDVVGSQLIGVVEIPAEQIYFGERVEGAFPILNSRKPCKAGSTLRLSIQYIPIEKQAMYYEGVGAGPDYSGVPGTYFPLRRGGRVTLYQDAHVPDGALPELKLGTGRVYEHGKCWRDIFEAISHARRLVYIVGWSVYHNVRLVRDRGHGENYTLGDLLKLKSQEGIRVLLLVWDDPTSRSLGLFKTDGVMQTHDEETRQFFKHSSVQVVLCPRSAGKRHSWAKQQETGVIYTHHQKTVIVDADAGDNRRKIIAFVGGLDLCDGRYDTPKHPLFSTLQTVHKDDYHNPTFVGSTLNCPREPWHDLHCKIDGPAAYDVLANFEERWIKASKPRSIDKLKRSARDDALLTIDRIPDIMRMIDLPCLNERDPESWHVQVFRSIDSNSVKGFPKDPRDATNKNLVSGKNVLIDMSIHTAYVKAIRAAQHFIYIENQYFLGSSYNWSSHNDLGANNLIPMEIVLKIANKIKAKERFAAYIVIPMWPEGVPTGVATQRILYWQNKTMQMMYDTIYRALEEVGLEKTYEPQDYLNFFCLGNREALEGSEGLTVKPVEGNTSQVLAQKSRRFMIYVHSKGMIVDDEYVLLGSANINQRSLEGTRDSEIAMGAYQPHHTWARISSRPHGQIHGYRMSLWAEHTGMLEDCFACPESLECVRRVRALGETNWRQFAADEVTEMSGHLLKYPVNVDPKGKVGPLPGCETFPDVGGNITGTFVAIQENLTI